MKIAGIDHSMNSPAIVVAELDDELNVIGYDYINLFKTKKLHTENHILPLPEFDNECQRIIEKNKIIIDYLMNNQVECVSIEDYAFSGKGKVFGLAENTGYLKTELYKNNIPIRLYDITSNKMYFCGKGNADKDLMVETYKALGNPLELPEKVLLCDSPLNDIVDAFSLLQLLIVELKLRRGLIDMKSLKPNVIRVFNTIRKDSKTNLLDTDFIGFKNA